MSYANFIPTVWNEAILRELKRSYVFAADCHNVFTGAITKAGDSITFRGLGDPTIKTVNFEDRNNDIDAPETVEDQSLKMEIRQIRYFNFEVGDIDRTQASGNLMNELAQNAARRMANEVDKYIAGIATRDDTPKLYAQAQKVIRGASGTDGTNVLDLIDYAYEKLAENDVPDSTPVIMTVSPRFYTVSKQAYRDLDTDNSEIMKRGRVGMYNNVTIKLSNNVARSTDGTVDHILIRTKEAIGYADALSETKAYEPEARFSDALKGLHLFDAKLIRPKQCFSIPVKYA